jgi:acyl-coenzyme A synthetase/AMP-(fatty) acid ligase
MEPGGNVVLCMLGLGSVWGYTIACSALASRKTLCFVISPFQAIRMVELFSVDFVFASTDQLVALIRVVRKSGAQLRSLRTVVTGGSVPTRALLEAATLHLCKNVLCRYGTSELGSVAEASASEILAQPTLVGHIQPEYEMAVVAPDGAPCPSGKLGLIKGRIRRNGPNGPEPWIDNGDLGWISSDGRLFVVGRTADIQDLSAISIGKISPEQEVEHLLRFEWDAADAAAVLVDDRPSGPPEIWVGVVDSKNADAGKLEAILRQRGIPATVRLFALSAIPRGANGKIQRGRVKSLMAGMTVTGR